MLKRIFIALLIVTSAGPLTGCIEDSSDDNLAVQEEQKNTDSTLDQARLSIAITDAPVDKVNAVYIQFYRLALESTLGATYEIELALPVQVDLLELQGAKSDYLIYQFPIPADHYRGIKLYPTLTAPGLDYNYNYIDTADGRKPLRILLDEDGSFTVPLDLNIQTDEQQYLTIDIDLRTSLLPPSDSSGAYTLIPQTRIVETQKSGHITGMLSNRAVNHIDCDREYMAVYLYEGWDIIPDDYDGISPADDESDAGPAPFTTTLVEQKWGGYYYEFGFIPAGQYTMAYTCSADFDRLQQIDSGIRFLGQVELEVFPATFTRYNF